MLRHANRFNAIHTHVRAHSTLGSGHLHALPDQKRYAVSILSKADLGTRSLADNPAFVIGWATEKDHIKPKSFVANNQFIDFMTRVFAKRIHQVNDTSLKGMAQWQKEGWLHIGDERHPAPWGRIPRPEDIIGSVLLEDGKIQPGTYQAMPAYRLVTNKGLIHLSKPLQDCLVDEAKKELK
ncbi:hypothetical protein BC940DRAFT_278506 [Gongronella butleri]|nr:hypothetical protein BC940DRAFT_278506 [Gongronella butleri]